MWRLIPIIFSCLLLAAHFFRAGLLPLTVLCVVVAFLPFYKTHWVPWFMQICLLLGTLEWIRVLIVFSSQRIESGQPWVRLVLILAAVALITLLSAFLFQNKALRAKYKLVTENKSANH